MEDTLPNSLAVIESIEEFNLNLRVTITRLVLIEFKGAIVTTFIASQTFPVLNSNNM